MRTNAPTDTIATIAKPISETAQAPNGDSLLKVKNILVPIDFSECSKKALKYAVPFAKQFNAGLTLLHVAEFNKPAPGTQNPDSEVLEAQMLQGCETSLLDFAKEEVGDKIACEVVVWKGKAVPDIIAAAKSRHIDLIIISTHGQASVKHSVLGSTTERVVRHAPCPVLVVRENEHEFIPES